MSTEKRKKRKRQEWQRKDISDFTDLELSKVVNPYASQEQKESYSLSEDLRLEGFNHQQIKTIERLISKEVHEKTRQGIADFMHKFFFDLSCISFDISMIAKILGFGSGTSMNGIAAHFCRSRQYASTRAKEIRKLLCERKFLYNDEHGFERK